MFSEEINRTFLVAIERSENLKYLAHESMSFKRVTTTLLAIEL